MQHMLIKKLQIDKKDLKDENKSFPLMSKDKHYEQFLIYPSRLFGLRGGTSGKVPGSSPG